MATAKRPAREGRCVGATEVNDDRLRRQEGGESGGSGSPVPRRSSRRFGGAFLPTTPLLPLFGRSLLLTVLFAGLSACGVDPVEAPAPAAPPAAAPAASPPDLTYPGEEAGTAAAEAGEAPPETSAEAVPPEPSVPPPLDQVRIFLVDVEAGAGEGEEGAAPAADTFGCGDRLVGIAVPVATEGLDTAGRIGAALSSLLVAEGGEETPGDLYSALARSELTVDRVEAVTGVDGLFRVHLAGQLRLGGVCDNPRVRAQLEATARQFAGVEEVEIVVGGEPLEAVLSGR